MPKKSQAQNPHKSTSSASLTPELNQKRRLCILNRKDMKQTQSGNQRKIKEVEARINAVVVPLQKAIRRDSVRHSTQKPSGKERSREVSSSERERRTSETSTCIKVEPLPPTPVKVLNDSLEIQKGRKNLLISLIVCPNILLFSAVSIIL